MVRLTPAAMLLNYGDLSRLLASVPAEEGARTTLKSRLRECGSSMDADVETAESRLLAEIEGITLDVAHLTHRRTQSAGRFPS